MLTWFIYDITNDKVRSKIVKIAREYGLYRVQKSVFCGNVNMKEDSVYTFPMCEKDFRNAILLGQSFDKEIISDNKKALFL